MDMHIAHRREHQLTAGIIRAGEASGWLRRWLWSAITLPSATGGLPFGNESVPHTSFFILKAAFQQDIIEIGSGVVGADNLYCRRSSRISSAHRQTTEKMAANRAYGGDHFSALAEKSATVCLYS